LRSIASGRRYGWGGKQIAHGPAHCSDKSDVFFGKVDPQGNVLTKKAIKITKNYDGGYSISKTADGGYIIGGEAGSSHNEDFMMLKVDQNGNKQWWKKFSDKPDNSAYDAIEASDGNFYLVGKKRIITSLKTSESSKQIPKAKKSGIKLMVVTKKILARASLNQKTIHLW